MQISNNNTWPLTPAPLILAIDDQQEVLSALTQVISKQGFNVHPTSSTKSALEYLASNKPQLIICDIMMPENNGYQF